MRIVILLIMMISSTSFSRVAPMKKVEMPTFSDDLHFENLLKAIARQEKSFSNLNSSQQITIGKRRINRGHLKKSLKEFKKAVTEALNCFQVSTSEICYEEFNAFMKDHFEAYRPIPKKSERGFKSNGTFYTAYYSPDLHGRSKKGRIYKNPIYAMPADPKLRKLTSDQINYGKGLKNQGLELFYVKESLYDIWLLHVEGGGRVRVKLKNGKYKNYYLSYAGTNKQKFQMLSRYMVENGMLRKGETSIENQRAYFKKNPKDRRKILASCPSFVFFKVTADEPLGVNNIPLTEGRSLATDYRIYKEYGIINFVKAKKPKKINGKVVDIPFSRFFINQDTGGAIRGNARSDLYFGYGSDAELAANFVHTIGKQYFLILK